MEERRLILSFFALAVAASLTLSCGGSSDPSSEHQLLSITLNPAAANAQDYPNGQVQFTATGYYKTAPSTVTPLSAGWGTCYQDAPTTAISVTRTGLAQCAAGAVGTYTVWANDPPFPQGINCNAITACGGGCFVAGTAQLSCGDSSSNRQLQSINIKATANDGQVQFTASGTFSAPPTTVDPLPVDWAPGFLAPPAEYLDYTLTTEPYVFSCLDYPSGTEVQVTAFAPQNPSAPVSGSSPWAKLVMAHSAIACP